MSTAQDQYYIPDGSPWPVVAVFAILMMTCGTALYVNNVGGGLIIMLAGLLLIAYLFYGWFRDVIGESMAGRYNEHVDKSFRQGMLWFISSEVFFFGAFFGSLAYIRLVSGPWLGGEGHLAASHLLWENFHFAWPMLNIPKPDAYTHAHESMSAWGIPALNTALLLSSGATVTWAHWALKKDDRRGLILGLIATVTLGLTFVGCQAYEYTEAYTDLHLTLHSGVFGSLFYMLTGFHGFHVIMGSIMLLAILGRSMKGHFSSKHHFAFEGVAWYWHFVDVVWLGLFIFVYMF